MIEIAWYNVVAIVVGILFVCLMCSFDDDHGFLAGIGGAFIFFLMIIFYTVWGGIFWW